jgi:predicted Na+-dependent transporter
MVLRLLKNRDFLLALGLVPGLFANGPARFTQDLTLPVRAEVMTLSTLGVSKAQFQNPKKLLRAALWGIALNYLPLSSLILAMSRMFHYDRALYDGFVILAAMPPRRGGDPFYRLSGG